MKRKTNIISSFYSSFIVLGIKPNLFLTEINSNLKKNDIVYFEQNGYIIGEAKIKEIINDSIDNLWYNYGFKSLMPQCDFDNLFKNKTDGICLELSSQKKYSYKIKIQE